MQVPQHRAVEPAGDPMNNLRRPVGTDAVRLSITPESAGWRYLSFAVVELAPGQVHHARLDDQETAIVPLAGTMNVKAGALEATLHRDSVFTQMPHVVYGPPRTDFTVVAVTPCTFAIGSARAEGKYPARVFEPKEMRSELRGGGTSYRQVNHILSMPLPAEHLILYEVYVPRGTWAGWAPHCHDGRQGSPYLEEVYYFRQDPADGFILHRNWRDDENFNEVYTVADGDCVLVPKGFHSTVACPNSHMFFLNFLAGDLYDTDRGTPPCFHADYTWLVEDWSAGQWDLPVVRP
jgi:5-deoxy-glucuronate isomerase